MWDLVNQSIYVNVFMTTDVEYHVKYDKGARDMLWEEACSFMVIPNNVATIMNLIYLVTRGNIKEIKSWKIDHIMSLLSCTYAIDTDNEIKKVSVDIIWEAEGELGET